MCSAALIGFAVVAVAYNPGPLQKGEIELWSLDTKGLLEKGQLGCVLRD